MSLCGTLEKKKIKDRHMYFFRWGKKTQSTELQGEPETMKRKRNTGSKKNWRNKRKAGKNEAR